LAATAAVLLTAGCGLGPNAPHPGLAASVGDQRLSLSTLGSVVDAACISDAQDPQGQPTTRGNASQQELTQWITAQTYVQYAQRHHLQANTTTTDLTGVPGWSSMSSDQQSAFQDFVDLQQEAKAIATADRQIRINPDHFDIVINPRFDIQIQDAKFVSADQQLSVGVSSEALAQGQQLDAAQLAALPAGQLCGKRPAAPTAGG